MGEADLEEVSIDYLAGLKKALKWLGRQPKCREQRISMVILMQEIVKVEELRRV